MRELVDHFAADVPVSTGSVLLCAENPYREALKVFNNSSRTLFCKWGRDVVRDYAGRGYDFAIEPGKTFHEPEPVAEVALYGLWSGADAAGKATVTEAVSRKRAGSGPNALAEALGYVCWTVDPNVCNFAATQANTHLGAVYLRKGTVISKLSVALTTAGAGLTFGKLGIYDKDYNLVAATPNSPAAFQVANQWVELALTAPYVAPYSGVYFLASGWLGTTLPTVVQIQHTSAAAGAPLPGGAMLGVHAAIPGADLPSPAVPTGNFTNFPLILAR